MLSVCRRTPQGKRGRGAHGKSIVVSLQDCDGDIKAVVAPYTLYKIYNDAPADVVVNMDDEGAINVFKSLYIRLD